MGDRDWARALELLRRAEPDGTLPPSDLELLADAERFAGSPAGIVRALEAAHAAYSAAGDARGAARAALGLVHAHGDAREAGPAGAWLERAAEVLEGLPECPEQGICAWMRGRRSGDSGRLDEHERHARAALAIAHRLRARSVESLARLDLGALAVARGDTSAGLAEMDRATALVLSEDVGPLETGIVLCGAVWAYRSCGRWEVAEQWARTVDRWSERERTTYFPGLCRVHRAEVLRARGRLAEAERECRDAVRLLEEAIPRWATIAYAELGEVRRRLGDHAGAMEAFRGALELGWEPQPGLSLLMLAQGDARAAHRALERLFASEPPTWLLEDRTGLLGARVRVALATGAPGVARAALAELEKRAQRDADRWDIAAAAQARGEVALADGDARVAAEAFLQAKRLFGEVATPYETATAGAHLARALAQDGDARGADLERDAARAGFERIGARFAAEELGGMRADQPPATGSSFVREGDVWAIAHAGWTVRLRRTRGLDYLARLLARPGEDVAALALAAEGGAVPAEGPGGARLDRAAVAAYRARLSELESEVDEAAAHGDAARQEQAALELDALRRELAASVGLGGRPRVGPSVAERARQSVTKAIRGAVRRIAAEHAELGRHLDAAVRTGALCRYAPEREVAWRIAEGERPEVTS